MERVLCRKCPECGLFNDFTVEICGCGEELNGVRAQYIDVDELSGGQFGQINPSLKAYVQKCPACGALSYTDDPRRRVTQCYNCSRTRIASAEPVECVDEYTSGIQGTAASGSGKSCDESSDDARRLKDMDAQSRQTNDDDDDESAQWQTILGNIQKTVGGASDTSSSEPGRQSASQAQGDYDDEDDVEAGDWSQGFGADQRHKSAPKQGRQAAKAPAGKTITLTAVRYGSLSFTVEAGQTIYMLGRSANQGDFLSRDGRVGNEHCYLFYRNGAWFVRDNNSKNGTAVNSEDIGLNGERMLADGDELLLGHSSDSPAFRITIK